MSRFPLLVIALAVVAAGCNSSDTKPFPTSKQSPAIDLPPGVKLPDQKDAPKDGDKKVVPMSSPVGLKAVAPDAVEAAVREQKGKIVVLDIWATWCVPCKKEFPHLVELHERRAKDGIVCMSVALDEEKRHASALDFLTKTKAEFDNFRVGAMDDDPVKKWLDKYSIGPIPVVLVFGRDGKLAKKFSGDDPDKPFTYADVNKLVDQLVAN